MNAKGAPDLPALEKSLPELVEDLTPLADKADDAAWLPTPDAKASRQYRYKPTGEILDEVDVEDITGFSDFPGAVAADDLARDVPTPKQIASATADHIRKQKEAAQRVAEATRAARAGARSGNVQYPRKWHPNDAGVPEAIATPFQRDLATKQRRAVTAQARAGRAKESVDNLENRLNLGVRLESDATDAAAQNVRDEFLKRIDAAERFPGIKETSHLSPDEIAAAVAAAKRAPTNPKVLKEIDKADRAYIAPSSAVEDFGAAGEEVFENQSLFSSMSTMKPTPYGDSASRYVNYKYRKANPDLKFSRKNTYTPTDLDVAKNTKPIRIQASHGTGGDKDLVKLTQGDSEFIPMHLGTNKAALDRVNHTGWSAGGQLHRGTVNLKQPLGSFDNPVDEGLADLISDDANLRAAIKADGFDGVVYRNTTEDRGSLSILTLDRKPSTFSISPRSTRLSQQYNQRTAEEMEDLINTFDNYRFSASPEGRSVRYQLERMPDPSDPTKSLFSSYLDDTADMSWNEKPSYTEFYTKKLEELRKKGSGVPPPSQEIDIPTAAAYFTKKKKK
jgi:hypothetical protein